MKEYNPPLEQRAQSARWLLHVALDVLNSLQVCKDSNETKYNAIRTIKIAMRELKRKEQ